MGSTGYDDRYAENWQGAADSGIPRVGAYHYVITNVAATSQLQNILRVTGGDFGSEPFTVDVERTNAERTAMQNGWIFPKASYTAMLAALCQALRVYTPVRIYSSAIEWRTMTTGPLWAAGFPFHVAAYPFDPNSTTYRPDVPYPWTDWTLWQYSSSGRVPGIVGDCDLNRERAAPPAPPPADPLAAAVAGHARSILELV